MKLGWDVCLLPKGFKPELSDSQSPSLGQSGQGWKASGGPQARPAVGRLGKDHRGGRLVGGCCTDSGSGGMGPHLGPSLGERGRGGAWQGPAESEHVMPWSLCVQMLLIMESHRVGPSPHPALALLQLLMKGSAFLLHEGIYLLLPALLRYSY